jgi:hypothetical protein
MMYIGMSIARAESYSSLSISLRSKALHYEFELLRNMAKKLQGIPWHPFTLLVEKYAG